MCIRDRFMAVAAAILVGVEAIVLYRDCAIPWLGMFLFVSFNFFGNSMSFIRQSFAIAIFLFAIRYLTVSYTHLSSLLQLGACNIPHCRFHHNKDSTAVQMDSDKL